MGKIVLADMVEKLQLETVFSSDKKEVDLPNSNFNRPGLQLAGFYEHYASQRAQIMGQAEISYIEYMPCLLYTSAEAYPGPSIVIGYAPCEMHGLKGGMTNCQSEMKKAVDAGYWQLFRFNPALKAEGKNPFSLDSKEPTTDYIDFIKSETRYSRLAQQFPERAEELFTKASAAARCV